MFCSIYINFKTNFVDLKGEKSGLMACMQSN